MGRLVSNAARFALVPDSRSRLPKPVEELLMYPFEELFAYVFAARWYEKGGGDEI